MQNCIMKNDDCIVQIMVLMLLAVTGMMSPDQVKAMLNCVLENGSQEKFDFLKGISGATKADTIATTRETITGMSELASFIGTSVPTACKLSRSGRFDEARLDFGSRKMVWDKAKLIEIAKKK